MVIFAAWLLKITWEPATASAVRGTILGGRVRLSGLELPALLFAFVVLLQLVPLPPSVMRIVSPRTAGIYEQSLPGYGEPGDPSFKELPQWLQSDADPVAGGVEALPPDREAISRALPEEAFDLSHSAWRPISLTPSDTKRALAVYLAYLALFIVAFNHLANRPLVSRYIYILAGLAGIISLLGILQNLTPRADYKLYWWRSVGQEFYSFGPFANANHFAGWMEMVLPLSAGLCVMVWLRPTARANLSGNLLQRTDRTFSGAVILGFITIVSCAALVISKSRGGIIAFAGALIIFCFVSFAGGRLRMRTAAVALLILLAALAMAAWVDWPVLSDRYGTLGNIEEEPSFLFRLAASKRTLRMAADFPLLGTGLGTFEEAYYLYTPGTSARILGKAHNDYAQVISECGLLGLLALGWGLAILIMKGLGPGLARGGSAFSYPVRGAAIGVLALLLHSFADFNLQIYSNGLLFVFLCSFLMRDRFDVLQRARR
jgi:O-antigen ligase